MNFQPSMIKHVSNNIVVLNKLKLISAFFFVNRKNIRKFRIKPITCLTFISFLGFSFFLTLTILALGFRDLVNTQLYTPYEIKQGKT